MTIICERTQTLAYAEGAVIELIHEHKMIYKATSGILTKFLGLEIDKYGSLSGLSASTGEVLYSEDTELDPRVDKVATRTAGIGSMICVPLLNRQFVVGILKVVAKEPKMFSEREIHILRLIAGILGSKLTEAQSKDFLIASEKKFRDLFENASDAIVISKDGIAIEANAAFSKLYGYSSDEIKGLNLFKLAVPLDRKRIETQVKNDFSQLYETEAFTKDGNIITVEAIGRTHTLDGEKIRVTTTRDITQKKRIEEALILSEQRARETAQAKSEFLANMSHEIRTPLNGIIGMANILEDTKLSDEQKKYVKILTKSAESLISIVNDILDFSKIEAKKLSIEHIPFTLKDRMEDIHQLLSLSASEKGLVLKLNFSDDLPVTVCGDPGRIRQVVTNLISNSIKFTHKGTIHFNVLKTNKGIRFEVEDSGIGISDESLSNIFEPFVQGDQTTTRKFGGTGLGLSICKELVRAMNGEIGVQSKIDKGSLFWFELPLTESLNLEKMIESPALECTKVKRILIVEDNPVNSLIARRMVEKLGHYAQIASHGGEALFTMNENLFDIILMDCQIPVMDGFEATKRIREKMEWKDVKIIAMTANAMSGDKEICLHAGMDDYITKPLRISELLNAINRS